MFKIHHSNNLIQSPVKTIYVMWAFNRFWCLFFLYDLGEDTLIGPVGDTSFQYMTTDDMKTMHDDSISPMKVGYSTLTVRCLSSIMSTVVTLSPIWWNKTKPIVEILCFLFVYFILLLHRINWTYSQLLFSSSYSFDVFDCRHSLSHFPCPFN